ncbi:hypothetical protein CCR95_14905 [Thiocystis minor]|nr:hypothetical protein [Thiocystis minor]
MHYWLVEQTLRIPMVGLDIISILKNKKRQKPLYQKYCPRYLLFRFKNLELTNRSCGGAKP